MRVRSTLLASLALAAILGTAENAVAQSYPSRAITMIVPFPAGGPADTIGRIVAEGMRPSLGQQVIIENIAGATGSIAAARLAHAEPDGYTIGIGNTPTHVWNGAATRSSTTL